MGNQYEMGERLSGGKLEVEGELRAPLCSQEGTEILGVHRYLLQNCRLSRHWLMDQELVERVGVER